MDDSPHIIRYSYSNSSFSEQEESMRVTRNVGRSSTQNGPNPPLSPIMAPRAGEGVQEGQLEYCKNKCRQLEEKYEKSLEQISIALEDNHSLQARLAVTESQLSMEKDHMQNSKNMEIQKLKFLTENSKHEEVSAKLQEIRRLKDSIIVLEKERNSYRNETNQLAWRLTQLKDLEKTNEDYENKLALLSQELERLSRLNREKSDKETRMGKERDELEHSVRELRAQNMGLKEVLDHSSNQLQGKYLLIIEERNSEIQTLNDTILNLEVSHRELDHSQKEKKHLLLLENQKIKTALESEQQEKQRAQEEVHRLSKVMEQLHSKEENLEERFSNTSVEISRQRAIILGLEQKSESLQREYKKECQMRQRLEQDMRGLQERASQAEVLEQSLMNLGSKNESIENQSIHLRSKIEEISFTTQRTQMHLQEALRGKDLEIGHLNSQIEQKSRKEEEDKQALRELENRNSKIVEELKKIQHSHQLSLSSQSKQEGILREQYGSLIGRMEQELGEMRRRNEEIRVENDRVIDEYRRLEKQYKFRVESLEDLAQRLQQYETQLGELQQEADQKQSLRDMAHNEAVDRIRVYEAEIEAQVRKGRSLSLNLEQVQEALSQKQNLLSKQSSYLEQVQRERQAQGLQLRNALKGLQKNIEEERRRFEGQLDRNNQEWREAMRKETEKFESAMGNTHSTFSKERKELEESRRLCDNQLHRVINNFSQERDCLAHALHEAEERIRKQQILLTQKNRVAVDLEKIVQQLVKKIQEHEKMLGSVKMENQMLVKELNDLQSRMRSEGEAKEKRILQVEEQWKQAVAQKEHIMIQKEQTMAQKEQIMAQKEQAIAQMKQAITEKDQTIVQKEQTMVQMEQAFGNREHELIRIVHERDQQINHQIQEIDNKRNQLEHISVVIRDKEQTLFEANTLKENQIIIQQKREEELMNRVIPTLQEELRNCMHTINTMNSQREVIATTMRQENEYLQETIQLMKKAEADKNQEITRLRSECEQERKKFNHFVSELKVQAEGMEKEKEQVKAQLTGALNEMGSHRNEAVRIEGEAQRQNQSYQFELNKMNQWYNQQLERHRQAFNVELTNFKEINESLQRSREEEHLRLKEQKVLESERLRVLEQELVDKTTNYTCSIEELESSYEAQTKALRNEISHLQGREQSLQNQLSECLENFNTIKMANVNLQAKVLEEKINSERDNQILVERVNEILAKNESYYATITNYMPSLGGILEEVRHDQVQICRKLEDKGQETDFVHHNIDRISQGIQELVRHNQQQVAEEQKRQGNFDGDFILSSLREELQRVFQDFMAGYHSLEQFCQQAHSCQKNVEQKLEEIRGIALRIEGECQQLKLSEAGESQKDGLILRYKIENEELRKECHAIEGNYLLQVKGHQNKIHGLEQELRARRAEGEELTKAHCQRNSRKGGRNNHQSRESTDGSVRESIEWELQYEQKIKLLSQEIERLQSLLDAKGKELITLHNKNESKMSELHANNIDQLKKQILVSEEENAMLQGKVNGSLQIIEDLSSRLKQMTVAYNTLNSQIQCMEGKIVRAIKESEGHLSPRCQGSSAEERKRVEELEVGAANLRRDNLELKKKNYNYEIEFEKVAFMKHKISLLNKELDRVSLHNVDLAQQLTECRVSIGEDSGLERRLLEMMATMVVMSAEIESLRSRVR